MKEFSHIDRSGRIRMVDVSGKKVTRRRAVATGRISMSAGTAGKLREGLLEKGDALAAAKIAGITAAKRTGDLIPLCHPLPLDDVDLVFDVGEEGVRIEAAVVSTARTGVEMEALTAVAAAALTIYDMCKAVDGGMEVGRIRLVSKEKEDI